MLPQHLLEMALQPVVHMLATLPRPLRSNIVGKRGPKRIPRSISPCLDCLMFLRKSLPARPRSPTARTLTLRSHGEDSAIGKNQPARNRSHRITMFDG
jgi:hypothetical protein